MPNYYTTDEKETVVYPASPTIYVLKQNLIPRNGYKLDPHIKPGALVRLIKKYEDYDYGYFSTGHYVFCCMICGDASTYDSPAIRLIAPREEITEAAPPNRGSLIDFSPDADL